MAEIPCLRSMAAPGSSWLLLAASARLLAAPGCSWLLLAPPGSSWLLLAAPGCSRRVRASLESKKLNTSHAKCKSSFIFSILLCVFEGRCHQVLYFTRKNADRQRHGLSAHFKGPLPTPLEPLSASTVWRTVASGCIPKHGQRCVSP